MNNVLRLSTAQPERLPSTLFDQSAPIKDLIPGGRAVSANPRFRDDVWNLAGHASWREKAGAQTKITFTGIPLRWRDLAKEFALLQLDPQLAETVAPDVPMAQGWLTIQERLQPVTVQANIKGLGHALRVIDTHRITEFTPDTWERLTVLLVQPLHVAEKLERLSEATGRMRAQQLIVLWQVSQMGDHHDVLGSAPPWEGQTTVEIFGRKPRRNAVRPNVEQVGDLLGLCAWIVDVAGEDIVAHVEWWAEQSATAEPPQSLEEARESMVDLCAQYAYEHDGRLPATISRGKTSLAMGAMARLLGIFDTEVAFDTGREARTQLADTVVYSLDENPCPLPIAQVEDVEGRPVPWVHRLLATPRELDAWQRIFVYAAMFYLSAAPMLRDSQIALLALDPLVTDEVDNPDGTTTTRHILKVHKTKGRAVPVPTEIVVNGRVAQIIALFQRLYTALRYEARRSDLTGEFLLVDQRLASPYGLKVRHDARKSLHLDLHFAPLMRNTARDLFDRGLITKHLDDVHVTQRQVRITVAQALASREHGHVLAAAQAQWDTRAVADGYIGEVFRRLTPSDPASIEGEVRRQRGHRLRQVAVTRDDYTGAGEARLDEMLDRNPALSNAAPISPSRLEKLGKLNPNISQGPLSLCVYQPEGAMCGGHSGPDFRLCAPGVCRNSVMSRLDRARYELLRRQHLALRSPVLQREAAKLDDANPHIRVEFESLDDKALQTLVRELTDDYVTRALGEMP